jgi:hypothetical protein
MINPTTLTEQFIVLCDTTQLLLILKMKKMSSLPLKILDVFYHFGGLRHAYKPEFLYIGPLMY